MDPDTTSSAPAVTLPTPPPLSPTESVSSTRSFPIAAVVVGIVLLVVLGGGYAVVVSPRITASKYSTKVLHYLPDLRTNLKLMNDALQNMYKLVSGQGNTAPPNSLLRVNTDTLVSRLAVITKSSKGEVAGAETGPESAFTESKAVLDKLQQLSQRLQQKSSFGGGSNVLGEATQIESKRTLLFRQLKEHASSAASASDKATQTLKDMDTFAKLYTSSSGEVGQINSQLTTQNTKAADYTSEVAKTATYYKSVSDIQIKLDPLLATYMDTLTTIAYGTPRPEAYNDQLEDTKKTLTAMNNELNAFTPDKLPKGIEDLHSDNKKVFELLLKSVDEVMAAIKADSFRAFASSVLSLQDGLQPLSIRAVTLEQNFWQNNSLLRSYKDISEVYTKEEKRLQDLKSKSKLPLLN